MSGTCTGCGTALKEGVAFCTACGTPVAAAATVAAGERVLAVIPNATVKGGFLGFGGKAYTLVLTERRVLFALITQQMMSQLVADARNDAKAAGKGFMGQWGAQLGAYSTFASRYLELPPERTLAENEGNFAVERATIAKAIVRTTPDTPDGNPGGMDRLLLKTGDRKFDILLGAGAAQARSALTTARMI